ncbi:MAG: type II toxin-antitoxin system RelE/ParE family toxin [Clostridia bacterium]|nr:type II toxin-antitoxin system RelE/ParE family toxin [Clostridia bacterium]
MNDNRIIYKYDFEFYEDDNHISQTYLLLKNLANSSGYQRGLFKSVYKKFEKLKLLGIRSELPDFEPVSDELWQMRTKHPEGSLRIILSEHPTKEKHFLILNCYNIRSFRTPMYEIEKGTEMYESFVQRYGGGSHEIE